MTHSTPDSLRHAEAAYESIRALNHVTRGVAPASLVYDLMGTLKGVANMLPQSLAQIADGLSKASEQFETYEDDGADSAERTAATQKLLMGAAELASELGDVLNEAQGTISHQVHKIPFGDAAS